MQNLAQRVLDGLRDRPGDRALVDPGGRHHSRGALRSQTAALARHLRAEGVVPGDRVVIQLPPGAALVAATLAVIALGAVPVLLEGGLGDGVYQSRIAASGARWLLVHPALQLVGQVPPLRTLAARLGRSLPPLPPVDEVRSLSARRLAALAQADGGPFAAAPVSPDQPCIVVYTGGTTQAPKGVLHTHGSLEAFLENIGAMGSLDGLSRMVVDTLPQALYALFLGAEAWLAQGRGPARATHVWSLLAGGTVQAYFGAPHLWDLMMRQAPGRRLPPSLATVLLGSAPVTVPFLRRLRGVLDPATTVQSLYGMTEAGPVCAASIDEKLAWTGEGDLLGRPVAGTRVTVDAPPGAVGELCIDGPSVARGYLGQPPRTGPLRTGDLGRCVEGEDGPVLVLMGRQKDMIIRRGVNLYPRTLEGPVLAAAAAAGLALADCAVVGHWDPDADDERVVLCAVPAPGAALDRGALARLAARALGPDGAPDAVVVVDAIPVKGRQNKRDLGALRALVAARLASAAQLASAVPEAAAAAVATARVRWRVPLDLAAMGEKALLRAKNDREPLRAAGELALRLGLGATIQAGWALDGLTAARWSAAPGLPPIFIVGHQRSGTTFLHRLLAEDRDHATSLTLHEMLLPALSLQAGVRLVARLDRALGGRGARWLAALQDRLLGGLDPLHRVRLDAVEEDELVLWAIGASIMVANDRPGGVARAELDRLRHFERWPRARQQAVLAYYAAVLQKARWRRRSRPGPQWVVAKNPAFSQKIPQLAARFPGARFVHLQRSPLAAIPSRLALLQAIWSHTAGRPVALSPAHVQTMLRDSLRTYRMAARDLAPLPPSQVFAVPFSELRADPAGVVTALYAHFDLPGPGPAYRDRLARLPPPPPRRLPPVTGLSADEIRAALPALCARYPA